MNFNWTIVIKGTDAGEHFLENNKKICIVETYFFWCWTVRLGKLQKEIIRLKDIFDVLPSARLELAFSVLRRATNWCTDPYTMTAFFLIDEILVIYFTPCPLTHSTKSHDFFTGQPRVYVGPSEIKRRTFVTKYLLIWFGGVLPELAVMFKVVFVLWEDPAPLGLLRHWHAMSIQKGSHSVALYMRNS